MNGLVLAGGTSSRMGLDKAFISYHGLPQYRFLYDLLAAYCEKTFVSHREELDLPSLQDNPIYSGIGPMAGLLTAFDLEKTDWLVLAVDYPLLSSKEIELLISSESETATVMYNSTTNLYEPTIGLYRKKFKTIILDNFHKNQFSLQKILQENNIERTIPKNLENIYSIDNEEEMMSMKRKLNSN